MPPIRFWIVEQTRRVRVQASSAADAVRVGNAAFNHEDHNIEEIGGFVTHPVQETGISASEDV